MRQHPGCAHHHHQAKKENSPSKRPRGEAPKDASNHQPRRIDACYHAVGAGARQRAIAHKLAQSAPLICFRGALAFRRFAAALAAATERRDSAQAVLRANERMRVLPAPSIALKRSTPRSGRNAGGNDARAARERSANPRAGAASRSTLWIASGMRPRLSGMLDSNRKKDRLSMRKGHAIGSHFVNAGGNQRHVCPHAKSGAELDAAVWSDVPKPGFVTRADERAAAASARSGQHW